MELIRDESGRLALRDGTFTLAGDFERLRPRISPHALNRELLVRAARLKGLNHAPVAVDACAGLGEDGFLLAAAGFQVTLIERDPMIAALTRDAIARARQVEDLREAACRMSLLEGDAASVMPTLRRQVDLVYLDPMFPERRKDAATKKKLALFRKLERPATDAEAEGLLEAAYALIPRRIVVKRPLKGPCLGSAKPSHTLSGKLIRYDCLIG